MELHIMKSSLEKLKILMEVFVKVLYHFFPEFKKWLTEPNDPRCANKITYPICDLLFSGILIFLFRLGARRQFHLLLDGEEAVTNLKNIFGMVGRPHGDTLLCYKKLKVLEISEIRRKMINKLIRMRVIEQFRLLGKYYMVAGDGTGVLVFKNKHCEHCLKKEHKSSTTYYHPVFEFKLTTENGMALSMDTEFIENPEGWDKRNEKQDCELKAFYRASKQLKKDYPRLSMCLLLDGLFPKAPVFDICEKNHWKYIITLKNNLKYVSDEFEFLLKLNPKQQKIIHCENSNTQIYRWVNKIEYSPRETTKAPKYSVNVFDFTEISSDGEVLRYFRWVTNIKINRKNVYTLCHKGGRLRWKIENEGFNTQKNGGYKLEHAYCEDYTASKVFYILLQIACIISRLIELSSLLKKTFPKGFGSYRNIAAILLNAFQYLRTDFDDIQRSISARFQIRFDTS